MEHSEFYTLFVRKTKDLYLLILSARFDSDVPVSYLENKEALLQALDRLGWPVSAEDVMLLEDEIVAGKTYLQQATDLQEASNNNSKVQVR